MINLEVCAKRFGDNGICHVRPRSGAKTLCGHDASAEADWGIPPEYAEDAHPEMVPALDRCPNCYRAYDAMRREDRGEPKPEARKRDRKRSVTAKRDADRWLEAVARKRERESEAVAGTVALTAEIAFRMSGAELAEIGGEIATAEIARRKAKRAAKRAKQGKR